MISFFKDRVLTLTVVRLVTNRCDLLDAAMHEEEVTLDPVASPDTKNTERQICEINIKNGIQKTR